MRCTAKPTTAAKTPEVASSPPNGLSKTNEVMMRMAQKNSASPPMSMRSCGIEFRLRRRVA
jgi:hypothetical protein